MRTKFSLGLGFTKDTKVTAISKDIPFVSTPNELHELVKTGKISGGLKSTEAVKEVAVKAKPAKRKAMTEVKSTKRKVAAKTKPAKREAVTKAKPAKQKKPQGIPNPVRDNLPAKSAKGFRKTVNRELGGSFHAPHEAVVGGTSAPVTRVSRPVVKEQSRFKRNAIFLLDSMSRTAGGKSSSDNAALNQARIDFYTSKEKIPCTDYVILFDREDAHSVEEQKEICRTCPLIDKCLKMALLGDEPFGVWGGMDPNERRVLKRRQMRIRRSNALGGVLMFDPLIKPSYEDEYPRLVLDPVEMAKHIEKVDMPLIKSYTKSDIGPTERIPVFLKNGEELVKKGSVSRKSLMDFIALVNRASIKAYDENREELVGNNIYQLSLAEF